MHDVPYGRCHCGCGEKTKVAAETNRRYGHVKGEPLRFVNGHNMRRRRDWLARDTGHTSPCWDWQGTIDCYGYGVLRVDYVQVKAHRWVYEREVGPIPDGLTIDHLCRNKRCVNPAHLEPVTHEENSRRHWAHHRAERSAA